MSEDRHDFDNNFPLVRKLDRIAGKVHNDLPQSSGISDQNVRDFRSDSASQFDPLTRRSRRQRVSGIADAVAQAERDRFEFELSGLDLREVENVVEQSQQRVGRLAHHIEIVALVCLKSGTGQQLCHPNDTVHWRADFMTHVGKKFAFRSVRRFGRLTSLMQRLFIQLSLSDVMKKSIEHEFFAQPLRRDRDLDGKLAVVAPQRRQLQTPIEHIRLASFQKSLQAAAMSLVKRWRNDDVGNVQAEHFVAAPAEHRLSLRIPLDNLTAFVDRNKCVVGSINDAFDAFSIPLQFLLCFFAASNFGAKFRRPLPHAIFQSRVRRLQLLRHGVKSAAEHADLVVSRYRHLSGQVSPRHFHRRARQFVNRTSHPARKPERPRQPHSDKTKLNPQPRLSKFIKRGIGFGDVDFCHESPFLIRGRLVGDRPAMNKNFDARVVGHF